MINFVITYQILSQIILNFLKISADTAQGVPSNSIKIKAIKDSDKTTKKVQFHSNLLFKRIEYVWLVRASF